MPLAAVSERHLHPCYLKGDLQTHGFMSSFFLPPHLPTLSFAWWGVKPCVVSSYGGYHKNMMAKQGYGEGAPKVGRVTCDGCQEMQLHTASPAVTSSGRHFFFCPFLYSHCRSLAYAPLPPQSPWNFPPNPHRPAFPAPRIQMDVSHWYGAPRVSCLFFVSYRARRWKPSLRRAITVESVHAADWHHPALPHHAVCIKVYFIM